MRNIIRTVCIWAALLLPMASFAQVLSGDVSGGGSYSGTVTNSSAWIQSNPSDGEQVNFWSFSANAGDLLSIVVNSQQIEFGVSVYQGLVDSVDVLTGAFLNDGDFGGNVFVAGTNPVTGAIGTSLVDISLPVSGIYTIAVGGESGMSLDGLFSYTMDVAVVPLPGAIWLLVSALMGMGVLRRRS